MDFRILGPLEVWNGDRAVPVSGATQRALLAILLLHRGEVVSADRLMDDLWGENPPASGATALRVRVSQLRKALGPGGDLVVTRPPGYALMAPPDQVDLARFERLLAAGERALAAHDHAGAVDHLQEALGLWRGMPLADLAYAPFAQGPIARLEELRLAALELRIDAELALGRHALLVAELRALVTEHPLRERLWAQLMLALYRDGRQAESLGAFASARARLVDEFGIDPGPALQELQRQVLAQDAGLYLAAAPESQRTILVLQDGDRTTGSAVDLARPLAASAGHELVVIALVGDPSALAPAGERLRVLSAEAAEHGVRARVAAFTTSDPGGDAVRLVADQDVALLLLDAPAELLTTGQPDAGLATLMTQAACDVALVGGGPLPATGPVLVPFAGHEHDWAALELAAWLAQARGAPLRLAGVEATPDGRDASRLLAGASLALQRALGVLSETVLVPAGTEGVLAAAQDAAAVVVGLPDGWTTRGVGEVRLGLARDARPPVLLVRRGLRPGGMAPRGALTQFTWSALGR